MKKFQPSANYRRCSTKWISRSSVTGTTSVTRKSKRIWRFIDHAEWLRVIGPRAFGCHVQDCIWPAQDHRSRRLPAHVDFEKLVPLLPTNCLFVWEMSPNKSGECNSPVGQIWKERFGE